MDNMTIYNAVRAVPDNAKKAINGGRLNGKTNINPMWRIKAMTEQFGPCGIGWKYVIREKRLEAGANGEVAAFVDIDLYYKADGEWSDAVPGTGGASFIAKENKGPYTSDECFKMALTDAISVSCKAIGMGADVYWDSDRDKYDAAPYDPPARPTDPTEKPEEPVTCMECGRIIKDAKNGAGEIWRAPDIVNYTLRRFHRPLCITCMNKELKHGV